MTTERKYVLPVGETAWTLNGETTTVFRWEYDDGRQQLLDLYEKGKREQWNASDRIDWAQDLDPDNPSGIDDSALAIYGSDIWNRMTPNERANLRRHAQAWQISQFLHGEQGALIGAARIVQQAPDIDAKYFAATQVIDEARHVEIYSRLLHEKFEVAYPISPPLKSLLDGIVTDSRWDMTYLGIQVMVEGFALAAFQLLRDDAKNPLVSAINAYVMQDEARHVAFGRLALRDYYPHLSDAERSEREEFVVEACFHLRSRFMSDELWEAVGLPKKECVAFARRSETMNAFRIRLFSRIVPTVRDIGLWGPKVKKAFADMGVLYLGQMNLGPALEQDGRIAERFDDQRVNTK